MSSFTGNSSHSQRLGTAVICVAQFVVVLDATSVATALPMIGADLSLTPVRLAWVVTSYTAVMAGLLILGGRLADLFGSRRMFVISLMIFTAASIGCCLAWSPGVLIGARVVQGIGAAMLSPAALAALNDLIRNAEGRQRALGWWTAAAAGGGASGWMLGGLLTQFAGWRWIFVINAPIGIAALLLSRRVLAEPGQRSPSTRRLDVPGAVAVTGGIGVLTLGLSKLADRPSGLSGWLALAAAAALLAGFAAVERRGERPLVPPSLLRLPGVVGGNLTATALTASTTSAMLAAVFYVQDSLRLPPAVGSLVFPAFNVAVIAGSLLGPRLLTRVTARIVLFLGFGAIATGAALLLILSTDGPLGVLIAAFTVMGGGLGAASVSSTAAGMAQIGPADRGVGAGLLNSTAQLGNGLGLAVTAPLIASGAMTGYRLGFGFAVVIACTGVLAGLTVPRNLGRPSVPGESRFGPMSARQTEVVDSGPSQSSCGRS